KDPHAQFKKSGLQIAGVQSLEIFEQVHLSLKMDGLDVLSDDTKGVRTVQAVPMGHPRQLPNGFREMVDRRVVLVANTGPSLGSASGEADLNEAATWELPPMKPVSVPE